MQCGMVLQNTTAPIIRAWGLDSSVNYNEQTHLVLLTVSDALQLTQSLARQTD